MWLSQYDVIHPWDPVRVTLNKRFHVGQRTDWAWATVEPPLLLGSAEHATVALGARHQGPNVWEPVEWPVHVYVCTTDPALHGRDTVDQDALSIKAWGMLHRTRKEAETVNY
jgi:hypothetical protein